MRTLLLALWVLSAACASARRRAEGTIVRDVHFTGNGALFSGHNDYQLRTQMQHRRSKFGLTLWPLSTTVDPRTLDPEVLVRDAYRLEVWYAHHGWLDARVVGWSLEEVRPERERRAAVVDVWGLVEPGPVSVIREIRIEGLPPALTAVGNAALRQAPIREGSPYSLDAVTATRELVRQKLVDYARPYAQVEVVATAHPLENVVDVVLRATPGIVGTIGPVTIEGQEKVPERFIDQAVELEAGDPYSLDALQDAQRRLFDLGTFSVATVEPDLSDPTEPEVPVSVRVTESKFRTFRVGAGFTYDGYVPTVRASTRLTHVNLFRQLIRAELGGRVGVAYALGDGDVGDGFPTWGADLALTYPRLFSQRASLELLAEIEQDVYTGLWTYRRPQADLSLSYEFSDHVVARFGPHIELYQFLGEFDAAIANAQRRLFGIDPDEGFQYQLTALDQFFTVDWRNDPESPSRGTFWSLAFREAFPLGSNGYGFVRGNGEVRGYVPVRGRDRDSAYPVTLAGRLGGTLIVPYGETDVVPLPERAFLGGSTSIRGFRANQVGPYTTVCTYNEVEDGYDRLARYNLPQGGTVAAELGTELRYDWIYGIRWSVFADSGILSPLLSALGPEDFRVSAGTGLRYDTPVGPLRFDISIRGLYPEDRQDPLYFGCRLEDRVPRVYDLISVFPGLREERHPPFAIVFFLTFGEAL